jgi:hypothetical protein
MNLSEDINEWGMPIVRKRTVAKNETVQAPVQEEQVTSLEDVEMTIKYLSEVVEPKKVEIVSSDDEDESGTWKVTVHVNAGDLTPLVTAAREIAEKNDDDIESVLQDLLDLDNMTKRMDDDFWKQIKNQWSFSGSSIEAVSYPQKIEDFKDAQFDFEVTVNYNHPQLDQSVESMIRDVLKKSMKWWT